MKNLKTQKKEDFFEFTLKWGQKSKIGQKFRNSLFYVKKNQPSKSKTDEMRTILATYQAKR